MKDKAINDLLKRISDLEFEVERLEKDNKKFINTIKVVNNECNNLFNHLTKEDLDYKSRIDKAIEFIKKYGTEAEKEVSYYEHKGERFCICASDFNEGAEIVLDILKGVDKE